MYEIREEFDSAKYVAPPFPPCPRIELSSSSSFSACLDVGRIFIFAELRVEQRWASDCRPTALESQTGWVKVSSSAGLSSGERGILAHGEGGRSLQDRPLAGTEEAHCCLQGALRLMSRSRVHRETSSLTDSLPASHLCSRLYLCRDLADPRAIGAWIKNYERDLTDNYHHDPIIYRQFSDRTVKCCCDSKCANTNPRAWMAPGFEQPRCPAVFYSALRPHTFGSCIATGG